MLDGKQIKDASVADSKLVESYSKADGSRPFTNPVGGVTPVLSSDLATKGYADSLINGRSYIAAVRLATTASIAHTGIQTIDGVVGVSGNRILDKDNSTPSLRGIWIMLAGAWTRATDYDSSTEVNGGDLIPVQEGSENGDTAWELTTDGTITVGTTSLAFARFAGVKASTNATSNKFMAASATVSDFDSACATTLNAAPTRGGYVAVMVNGVQVEVGDAVKTKDCYFSSDGGTTAKAIASLAAGDQLYWVGSVAGYQLATTDRITFNYVVLN